MRFMLIAALAALALPAAAETPVTDAPTAAATDTTADPYLWLEDMHGEKALAWVEEENARSLAVLKGDPRYEAFHQDALKIVNAADRIPMPELIGDTIYNFWQDPTNVRGLWRRTTPASYATAAPAWETVLDLDKLSADEKANWVWDGANCPPPDYRRCLIDLSDGGEDADTRARVRPDDPVVRGRRVRAAAQQAERRLAGRRHADRRPRLGPGHDDRLQLSVRGQDPEARPEPRSGDGGVPRRAGRRLGRARRCCTTATATSWC